MRALLLLLVALAGCAPPPHRVQLVVLNARGDTIVRREADRCYLENGVAELYNAGEWNPVFIQVIPRDGTASCVRIY